MKSEKVYVASSWRNTHQEGIVSFLHDHGFEAYDFRNPESAFSWQDIDHRWGDGEGDLLTRYRAMLASPLAQKDSPPISMG